MDGWVTDLRVVAALCRTLAVRARTYAATAMPAANRSQVGITPRKSSVDPAAQRPQNQMNAMALLRNMCARVRPALLSGNGTFVPRGLFHDQRVAVRVALVHLVER
jgi:sulfur carrier protein ThiS